MQIKPFHLYFRPMLLRLHFLRIPIVLFVVISAACLGSACQRAKQADSSTLAFIAIDTTLIPSNEYGQAIKYGRELMLKTAYYIGPNGINGQYLGNKMNCSNCHIEGGTVPYALSLLHAQTSYPQYRARENKVLSLAERVNNCIMRPHSGRPLPLDGKEMNAFLSYFRWLNSFVDKTDTLYQLKGLPITYPNRAASSKLGSDLYNQHCQSCHGQNGEGLFNIDSSAYIYPPLWGLTSYQPGSSMHRISKLASWIKANMPHKIASFQKPVLSDEACLDLAAFINDDAIHVRRNPKTFDYPNPLTKPMDYGIGPYADTFSAQQHKYGPFPPIIKYWKEKGQQLNK